MGILHCAVDFPTTKKSRYSSSIVKNIQIVTQHLEKYLIICNKKN
jgi:hypothetical protein